MLKTPVAFIIFKRPDTTKKVFETIRQIKPSKLFVIADGPREEKRETEKCAATRAIIDSIDWDCEVLKNYSDLNLGCKKRVATGLDWVFSIVEEAIILEDDCVPHPTFYRFCEKLLEKYRDDKRIMTICGTNIKVLPCSTPRSPSPSPSVVRIMIALNLRFPFFHNISATNGHNSAVITIFF